MTSDRRRLARAAIAAACLVASGTLDPLPAYASPTAVTAPAAATTGDLVVDGRGWGHRRGLGQYGSLGYAIDEGWSSSQIVSHFYGGTGSGTVNAAQEMTVRVLSQDGRPLVAQVDSGSLATYVPGAAPVAVRGRAVRIETVSGGFRISDAATCAGPWSTRAGTVSATDLRVRAAENTTVTFSYGQSGDVPLAGDWNGDGLDTPGVWRAGTFYLRNASSSGGANVAVTFGSSTDQPIVGDWNGDGIDTVGVRRGNVFYLRDSNSGGGANHAFSFGTSTDTALVGDWNDDGVDSIGVRRDATWLLRNSLSGGAPNLSFTYGLATDVPVVGDWNGDGLSGIGVRRDTTWHLRETPSGGAATRSFTALGPGQPLAGRWWSSDAADLVGRFQGGTWELAQTRSGGKLTLIDGSNQPLDRTLQLCNATSSGGWTSSSTSSRFYRGELRAIADAGGARVVNALPLDWYVRGVVPRESPASWGLADCTTTGEADCGQAALEAQAIAARSYSLGEKRYSYAKTCDTISCQVYMGRAYRSAGSTTIVALEAATSNAAVATTSGQIRTKSDGTVARTEFSSSTGGWTAGGVFPSVVDDGDDTASNPNHTWSTTITAAQLSSRYGLGALVGAKVTSRSSVDGRAVTGLQLDFAQGSITRTGEAFRQEWGLRSTWFDLTAVGSDPISPARVGVWRNGSWYLRNSLSGGGADIAFVYGQSTDEPLVGDWNADDVDTPGVRRGTMWHLRNSNDGGSADLSFEFGPTGGDPLAGDWDGNGTETVGLRSGNTWSLRNANSGGSADVTPFSYGASSDVPVVGDWDGNGTDTPGVYRDGDFYLKNSLSGGSPDKTLTTGLVGVPVVGDWNGDGLDDLAVRVGSTFNLVRVTDGASMGAFGYGVTTDTPLAGRWQ